MLAFEETYKTIISPVALYGYENWTESV